MIKRYLALPLLAMAFATIAQADGHGHGEVKIGLLGGVTGPIANMAPAMLDGSQLAVAHVNAQGGILGGKMLTAVIGDSGCNAQKATDAANKAVNIEGVIAVVGAHCSGAVMAAANSVLVPANILAVTPSGTSPEITNLDDNDLVFRTVPSDSDQGAALARALFERGTAEVAVTYLNNDYGKGLADKFQAAYEALGGEIAAFSAHAEGKSSYRSDLASLARSDADTLVIFDYGDGSGLTILREALENGFFENFVGADGMKSEALINGLGADNLGTVLTSAPVGKEGKALNVLNSQLLTAGIDKDAIFVTTSYDAAFLLALAIEQNGGEQEGLNDALRAVASGAGTAIYPGEWEKAKALIAKGEAINYKGAAGDHEFDAAGDVPGSYALFAVRDGGFVKVADM